MSSTFLLQRRRLQDTAYKAEAILDSLLLVIDAFTTILLHYPVTDMVIKSQSRGENVEGIESPETCLAITL